MSNNLPATVAQLAPRLHQAARSGDPQLFRQVIETGYSLIGQVYDPDPLLRPHHYVNKWLAEKEWERLVRDTGKQLRQVAVQSVVREMQQTIDLALQQRVWEQTERQRRHAEGWNKDLRVDEYRATRSFDTDEEIRKARALAGISQEFGLNAANKPAEDPNESILKLNREMARVYADPTLSMEQKHIQTRSLQSSINRIIDQQGRQAERR